MSDASPLPCSQIPVDLQDKEFLPILQEEPLLPLALVSFTEEEQVMIAYPVTAVLPEKIIQNVCLIRRSILWIIH